MIIHADDEYGERQSDKDMAIKIHITANANLRLNFFSRKPFLQV